ncbi:MAG TPA: hypothetical protein PKE55_02330 [Kiritimatiellia bacterium]|nr:hypothetical protein [Kiritimatiellia bacterium]
MTKLSPFLARGKQNPANTSLLVNAFKLFPVRTIVCGSTEIRFRQLDFDEKSFPSRTTYYDINICLLDLIRNKFKSGVLCHRSHDPRDLAKHRKSLFARHQGEKQVDRHHLRRIQVMGEPMPFDRVAVDVHQIPDWVTDQRQEVLLPVLPEKNVVFG